MIWWSEALRRQRWNSSITHYELKPFNDRNVTKQNPSVPHDGVKLFRTFGRSKSAQNTETNSFIPQHPQQHSFLLIISNVPLYSNGVVVCQARVCWSRGALCACTAPSSCNPRQNQCRTKYVAFLSRWCHR